MAGRTRCRFHGGATPRGIDHPRWTGRGYSKDIPTRLLQRLEAALSDPELLSMSQEIALLDARVGELFRKFPTRESAEAWAAVDSARGVIQRELTALVAPGELSPEQRTLTCGRLQVGVDQLQRALADAQAERSLWNEILGAWRTRDKFVDTERKREELLQSNLTARQTMTLLAGVQVLLMEFITDPQDKQRAARRLRELVEPRAPRALPAGERSLTESDATT